MSDIVVKDAIIFITGANRPRGIGHALVVEAVREGQKDLRNWKRYFSTRKSNFSVPRNRCSIKFGCNK